MINQIQDSTLYLNMEDFHLPNEFRNANDPIKIMTTNIMSISY